MQSPCKGHLILKENISQAGSSPESAQDWADSGLVIYCMVRFWTCLEYPM